MSTKKIALIIGGPTASGKSGLAADVAAMIGGAVLNADSMQLYRGLPLLTAQPSAGDRAKAPHLLYETLPPDGACSAAQWRDMALAEIARLDGVPVITGGTGFYIRALTEGLSPVPAVPLEFRETAAALQREMGNPAFHEELKKRDPETAARLDPMNTQRNVRAWEVLAATGRGLAAWHAAPPVPPPAHLKFITATLLPPRAALHARCDLRFSQMLAAGALEEVRAFRHPGSPLCKALGYAELAAHLAGTLTLEQAAAGAAQATRNYAKRQTTWFRRQVRADIVLEAPDAAAVAGLVR